MKIGEICSNKKDDNMIKIKNIRYGTPFGTSKNKFKYISYEYWISCEELNRKSVLVIDRRLFLTRLKKLREANHD